MDEKVAACSADDAWHRKLWQSSSARVKRENQGLRGLRERSRRVRRRGEDRTRQIPWKVLTSKVVKILLFRFGCQLFRCLLLSHQRVRLFLRWLFNNLFLLLNIILLTKARTVCVKRVARKCVVGNCWWEWFDRFCSEFAIVMNNLSWWMSWHQKSDWFQNREINSEW